MYMLQRGIAQLPPRNYYSSPQKKRGLQPPAYISVAVSIAYPAGQKTQVQHHVKSGTSTRESEFVKEPYRNMRRPMGRGYVRGKPTPMLGLSLCPPPIATSRSIPRCSPSLTSHASNGGGLIVTIKQNFLPRCSPCVASYASNSRGGFILVTFTQLVCARKNWGASILCAAPARTRTAPTVSKQAVCQS